LQRATVPATEALEADAKLSISHQTGINHHLLECWKMLTPALSELKAAKTMSQELGLPLSQLREVLKAVLEHGDPQTLLQGIEDLEAYYTGCEVQIDAAIVPSVADAVSSLPPANSPMNCQPVA
jgi:hypothetical protein